MARAIHGREKLAEESSKPSSVSATRSAARIALAYAAWAILWILMSDSLVEIFIGERQLSPVFQMVKGLAFIAITAALLFLLITRHTSQLVKINGILAQHVRQLKEDIAERRRAERALQESETKQAVLSELGIHALSGVPLGSLFERAARKTAGPRGN